MILHRHDTQFRYPGPAAAVSYVEDVLTGRVLVVYNRRYGTWGLPGGKVEAGESVERAHARELREETGVTRGEATFVCAYPSSTGSGRMVFCYLVETDQTGRTVEEGSEVRYMDREELLARSAWQEFYEGLFGIVDQFKRHRR